MKIGMKQIWKYLAAGIMGLLGFASCGKSLADVQLKKKYPNPFTDGIY